MSRVVQGLASQVLVGGPRAFPCAGSAAPLRPCALAPWLRCGCRTRLAIPALRMLIANADCSCCYDLLLSSDVRPWSASANGSAGTSPGSSNGWTRFVANEAFLAVPGSTIELKACLCPAVNTYSTVKLSGRRIKHIPHTPTLAREDSPALVDVVTQHDSDSDDEAIISDTPSATSSVPKRKTKKRSPRREADEEAVEVRSKLLGQRSHGNMTDLEKEMKIASILGSSVPRKDRLAADTATTLVSLAASAGTSAPSLASLSSPAPASPPLAAAATPEVKTQKADKTEAKRQTAIKQSALVSLRQQTPRRSSDQWPQGVNKRKPISPLAAVRPMPLAYMADLAPLVGPAVSTAALSLAPLPLLAPVPALAPLPPLAPLLAPPLAISQPPSPMTSIVVTSPVPIRSRSRSRSPQHVAQRKSRSRSRSPSRERRNRDSPAPVASPAFCAAARTPSPPRGALGTIQVPNWVPNSAPNFPADFVVTNVTVALAPVPLATTAALAATVVSMTAAEWSRKAQAELMEKDELLRQQAELVQNAQTQQMQLQELQRETEREAEALETQRRAVEILKAKKQAELAIKAKRQALAALTADRDRATAIELQKRETQEKLNQLRAARLQIDAELSAMQC